MRINWGRTMRSLAIIFAALTAVTQSHAMFMLPDDVPVGRIARNLVKYIQENPKDPTGYYQLGRVDYLAYTLDAESLLAYPDDDAKAETEVFHPAKEGWQFDRSVSEYYEHADEILRKEQPANFGDFTDREVLELRWEERRELARELWEERHRRLPVQLRRFHISEAVKNLRKAINLSPKTGLYRLTLACALEEALDDSEALEAINEIEKNPIQGLLGMEIDTHYRDEAISLYKLAFELSSKHDLQTDHYFDLSDFVSYEAAEHYIALIQQRGATDDETALIASMRTHQQQLKELPRAITPIIFSTTPGHDLRDLVSEADVVFDLDGDGNAESWSWVKQDTAILVWDPHNRGRITSGRQLFGNATWWLLFPDGYRAMDALDNDRDGQLTGNELHGLAAWFDRNSDGVSEPGEVIPLNDLGVSGLRTQAVTREDGMLTHTAGLRLKNGQELPTWDWVSQRR